jgi:hypothetical protein
MDEKDLAGEKKGITFASAFPMREVKKEFIDRLKQQTVQLITGERSQGR